MSSNRIKEQLKSASEYVVESAQSLSNRIIENIKSKETDSVKAATVTGLIEAGVFHGLDASIKRLQKYKGVVYHPEDSYKIKYAKVCDVVFQGLPKDKSFFYKAASLYVNTGIRYAFLYKGLQRGLKLGLQPTLQDHLKTNYDNALHQVFGAYATMMTHIISGAILGVSEIVILPLDAQKIKYQTNALKYQGVSLWQVMKTENMFKAWKLTGMRNALGSGFWFLLLYVMKQNVFGLESNQKMTWTQNLIASGVSTVGMITVSTPLDVVRTRIVAEKDAVGAFTMAGEMLRTEGPRAFAKGLGPKLLGQGPKAGFAMFFTNYLTDTVIPALRERAQEAPKNNRPGLGR